MRDPYETLGVPRSATAAEIKAAFRKLTRKLHPDLHPGDAAAAETFRDISAAYDLIGDAERRRRFDAGEIDASGAETPHRTYWRDYADAGPRGAHAAQDGFASDAEFEEFLSRAFGAGGGGSAGARGARGGGGPSFQARGQDVSYSLPVAFLDAARGAVRSITLPDGKRLEVTIPEGARDRQMLRLRGQGMPGFGGGPPGDAYVELHVEPHAVFRRKDDDIHMTLPVTLKEAVLGAQVETPTIHGPVTLAIPRGATSGRVLRLRGKGVRRPGAAPGNQLVTLSVALPTEPEPELAAFLEGWSPRHPHDPRKEMPT